MSSYTVDLTKAIGDSFGYGAGSGIGNAVGANSDSVEPIVRTANLKSLSPRQAYELNLDFRSGVDILVQQIVRANRRIMTPDGEDIMSGPLYDFRQKILTDSFFTSLMSWHLIEGEFAVFKKFDDDNSLTPSGLVVLDPGRLQHYPPHARSLEYVQYWLYHDGMAIDGVNWMIQIPPERLMFQASFNPTTPVRGLSIAVSGSQELSTNYYSNRYNAAFFQNGARADTLIRLPAGTDPAVAKKISEHFQSGGSIFGGNAFKTMTVVGDSVEVEKLNTASKDGEFMNLMAQNRKKILSAMGVPPVLSGDWADVVHDSADVQYRSCFENRLMPLLHSATTFIQTQLIDPHFSSANRNSRKSVVGGQKTFKREFAKAITNSPSSVIFLLDPCSMPIHADLLAGQLNAADQYRRTMGVSFKAAAHYVGLDRESNEADDLIYVANDQINVTKPEAQQDIATTPIIPVVNDEDTKDPDIKDPNDPSLGDTDDTDEAVENQKSLEKSVEKFVRQYRSLVCTKMADSKLHTLAEIKSIIPEDAPTELVFGVHRDFLELRKIFQSDAVSLTKLRLTKDFFNKSYKKSAIKALARGTDNG